MWNELLASWLGLAGSLPRAECSERAAEAGGRAAGKEAVRGALHCKLEEPLRPVPLSLSTHPTPASPP